MCVCVNVVHALMIYEHIVLQGRFSDGEASPRVLVRKRHPQIHLKKTKTNHCLSDLHTYI